MKKLLLIFIILLAFIVRFYKLGSVPNGLQQDETSIGYNAYSILKTGKDEHGVFFPQNFRAFGEYKLPIYIYATVPPIAFFGLNAFSVRLVSAISGFLSVILVYFISKKLLDLNTSIPNKFFHSWIPLAVTFLLAINPWHIHFSRAAFEVTLANFFILLFVYFFLQGIKKQNMVILLCSIISLIFSIYTYNIARLFAPLLGIILVYLFQRDIKKIPKLSFIVICFVTLIFLLPFLLGIIHHGGVDSTTGTLIVSSAKVQAPLLEIRSYFVNLPTLINKIFFNYWILTLWQYVNNFFMHLSVMFYFLTGGDQGNNSIGTNGQWYIFELPLIVIGLCLLWKQKKELLSKLFFLWIVILVTISSLTREPPQATRTFFLIFPITYCSGLGLLFIAEKIKNIKKKSLRYTFFTGSIVIVTWYILFYFLSYYLRFPIYYAKNWRTADRDVSYYIRDHQADYNKIIIDNDSGFIYTSLLTYLPISPSFFQDEATWSLPDSEGFTHPQKFGKYEIRKIDWTADLQSSKTLIVTTLDKKPKDNSAFITFSYPERPVVINVGQQIMRYPVTDPAYVLISTQ